MADIISIEDRLPLSKRQKTALSRKNRFLAFRQTLWCALNHSRCEKCGGVMGPGDPFASEDLRSLRVPYRFCNGCAKEYIDYIDRLKGQPKNEYTWQNDDWLNLWRRWIDYQGALDQYMKSKEFAQIMSDMDRLEPGK